MGLGFALQLDILVDPRLGIRVAIDEGLLLNGVQLIHTDFGIGLGFVDKKRGKPYFVDFTVLSWRERLTKGLPKNHIFVRALGSPDQSTKILDATAGFGQDSVQALSLGCNVIALERSKEVAAVLKDGIHRALAEESIAPLFKKIKVIEADAREYLSKLTDQEKPDVIYIDPMFDKPKKSAKSPKSMQLLQELLGATTQVELEQLFDVAIVKAKNRVVVKQPLKGRALRSTPSHSFKGQSVRYDVYLRRD
jgi:16S rRNA (guanine1516-N2)-methyltransferase